ncbi:fimbrial protein [Cronobacter turicensis]|nr:fimbrial protein [Cronobacter turicensis]
MTENMAAVAKRWRPAAVLLLGLMMAGPSQALDNNLQISGTLVTEPCTMDVNSNTQTVDFGTVIEKGLYKDVRTPSVPLTITLTECDISIGKTVNLIFTGNESTSMPGYISTTGAGSSGVVIGIETPEGTNLPINKPTSEFGLQDGTTQIVLQAYVEAEADAIKNQSLVPGAFAATITIDAQYP